MHRVLSLLFLLMIVSMTSGCRDVPSKERVEAPETTTEKSQPRTLEAGFKDYWYGGKAELASYALEQARYGELRDGHAVLVFVTEPFDAEKQVKDERPDSLSVSVLKLNQTKKFLTGIYPYSIMTSIFDPVGVVEHPVKVSNSIQEWCGHVYSQLNNREAFEITSHSYFQQEADQEVSLSKSLTEDEIWTKLRLDPNALPEGDHLVLPSLEYHRLRHLPFKAQKARLTMSEEAAIRTYTITYPELNRTLQIHFEGEFPYTIQGWTESFPSGFGPDAPVLTTTARLKKVIKTSYWRQNSNADEVWRDSLGI